MSEHERLDELFAEHAWDDAPRPGDDDRVEAMIEAAMPAAAVVGGASAAAVGSKVGVGKAGLLAVLATILVGGGVVALLSSQRSPGPTVAPAVESTTAVDPAPADPPTSSRSTTLAAIQPEPEPEPELEPELELEPQPEPEARPKPPRPPSDPAELLEAANVARRAGEYPRARSLYRQLRREHRGTREELAARVSLGKLELDHLGHPERALDCFDDYLADRPEGTLAEAALAGRARALGALGRSEQERAAWTKLLVAFPDTMHRSRAQRRLSELQP
ncbi:hypothetical protein PPSIR1_25431 [Plesiocystis pacifica SIR-1]|uniref:Outer membrane lipoprotein BamD-like domain-containing protein n=1 Tax=Plesiocystis pacifica SIR-1 TaxID=391625 RepID=A6FZA0_9BACT|nr:hypothetical protein [Plesiocystis pacifica]EDM80984.1 hypothetical protein PPSIR1_25431 [Plesiocystis pacifica SIR-1]